MAKSPTEKTNGHTVSALKPAAPKKAAAAKKAAPAKPAAKAPATRAVKAATPKAPAAKAPAAKASAVKTAAVKAPAKAAVKAPAKPAAKAAPKVVAKPPVKAARKPAAKPAAQAGAAPDDSEAGRDKVRKAKLVRDSFTMPELEYAVLGQVKKACIKAGFEVKKSELLRIGVALISQLDMATLQKVLTSLPQLKTGRPKND